MPYLNLTERANRLRAAGEQCAQDRILIEQARRQTPRVISGYPKLCRNGLANDTGAKECQAHKPYNRPDSLHNR
jgi:hypothetical protein